MLERGIMLHIIINFGTLCFCLVVKRGNKKSKEKESSLDMFGHRPFETKILKGEGTLCNQTQNTFYSIL